MHLRVRGETITTLGSSAGYPRRYTREHRRTFTTVGGTAFFLATGHLIVSLAGAVGWP